MRDVLDQLEALHLKEIVLGLQHALLRVQQSGRIRGSCISLVIKLDERVELPIVIKDGQEAGATLSRPFDVGRPYDPPEFCIKKKTPEA